MTESRCFHCNETVPKGCSLFLVVDGKSEPMCCQGCLAVAECIQSSGLSDYYQFRTEAASTPDNKHHDFSRYNSDAVIESFSEQENHLWISRLSIGGLHCAACTWLIEHQLSQLQGVEQVSVHLQRGVATVKWNKNNILCSDILSAISQLGYQVSPYSPSSQQQLVRQELDGLLKRIGIAGIGMMQVGMVAIALYAGAFQDMSDSTRDLLRYFSLAVATPVLFFAAQPFLIGAWRNLRTHSLGMDIPVSIALIAAYIASLVATLNHGEHVYFDTISMFTFFLLISRYLQKQIQRQQNESALLPVSARRVTSDKENSFEWIPVADITQGDQFYVMPGEIIPADGKINSGNSSIEESAFTGEFQPKTVSIGDEVLAGTKNIDGSFTFSATSITAKNKLSQIDRLLERAQLEKPRLAQIADRIAGGFVAFVMFVSAASFVYWHQQANTDAFLIALAVLVISCPCALSLATPTTLTAAINGLRQQGILISNASTLENLNHVDTVVFDKTGTLTQGEPRLTETRCHSHYSEEQLLTIAASLEHFSNHPLAKAFKTENTLHSATNIEVISGAGVQGNIGENNYRIGSAGFCKLDKHEDTDQEQMTVYLCENGKLIGSFHLTDTIRPEAAQIVSLLQQRKLKIEILSGDHSSHVENVAKALNIGSSYSGYSAEDKLNHIQNLQKSGATVMMVGDGVNDAPVISAADVSIAMTSASELTRSRADGYFLKNTLNLLQNLFVAAEKTRNILLQNFAWALAYNLTTIPMAALGMIPPYAAAIGMSASSLIVILNALRLKKQNSSAKNSYADTAWKHPKELYANG